MRRFFAAASLALALLLTSAGPANAAGAAPYFNNYLVCFNGWIYVDFIDPDGQDVNLRTYVYVIMNDQSIRWIEMGNSGGTGHAPFWYLQLSAAGINQANVSQYWFASIDPTRTWSPYTRSDRNCNLI